MDISIKLNDRAFRRAMQQFDAESKKETALLLQQQARLFVRDVVSVTPPSHNGVVGTAAKKAGEKTVTTDLSRIFKPLSEALLSDFRAVNQGDEHRLKFGHKGAKALGDITEKILSFSEMDAWHQARRRKDGRVMKVHSAVTTGLKKKDLKGLDKGLVRQQDFARYLALQLKLVGKLASGWNAAASQLGLKLPSWISRHGTSRGSILMELGGSNLRILITNSVRFVGGVRDLQRRAQWALDNRARRMMNQLEQGREAAAKKAKL